MKTLSTQAEHGGRGFAILMALIWLNSAGFSLGVLPDGSLSIGLDTTGPDCTGSVGVSGDLASRKSCETGPVLYVVNSRSPLYTYPVTPYASCDSGVWRGHWESVTVTLAQGVNIITIFDDCGSTPASIQAISNGGTGAPVLSLISGTANCGPDDLWGGAFTYQWSCVASTSPNDWVWTENIDGSSKCGLTKDPVNPGAIVHMYGSIPNLNAVDHVEITSGAYRLMTYPCTWSYPVKVWFGPSVADAKHFGQYDFNHVRDHPAQKKLTTEVDGGGLSASVDCNL